MKSVIVFMLYLIGASILVSSIICISIIGITDVIKSWKELKIEGSTFKDKNFKWKGIFKECTYSYNKKADILVNTFINDFEKVFIYDDYNLCFCKNNKVLFVWINNKYYAYASIIRLCEDYSFDSYDEPICKLKDCRPSYKTMKKLVEIEDCLHSIGKDAAIYKEDKHEKI